MDDLEQLKRDIAYLKDRQDILDCIMREARGRDRQDVAITGSCYWDDGMDEHGPVITPAPDYPARANFGHGKFFSMTCHNITTHNCDLQGDKAYCETYVIGGLLSKDEQSAIITPGRYIDQMEKRNGEWRILVRRTIVEMSVEGSSAWMHSLALKDFPRGEWNKNDFSYQRPVVAGPGGRRWPGPPTS